jgi:hypothetical protein
VSGPNSALLKAKFHRFQLFTEEKVRTTFKSWQYKAEKINSTEPNAEKMIHTYADRQSGLVVKWSVTFYSDFQAVEWLLRFYIYQEQVPGA